MLIASAIVVCIICEKVATFGLERVSRIQRRMLTEDLASRNLRPAAPGQPRTVLFAGNSLLLAGLDMGALQKGLAGRYAPQRYVVEQTSYYDWRYGLSRLFRQGMRPDMVIVCLSPPQFFVTAIRGDFSARFLFDRDDIWPVSRAVGADLTTTSGLYVAHYSGFYAARSELRSVVMGKIWPAIVFMWQRSTRTRAPSRSGEALVLEMEPRLRELARLCEEHGAQFRFLIPTTTETGDTEILQAGERTGVSVMRPIPNRTLGPEYYEDGFHLNAKGAALFTRAIVDEMMR